jgi:hypothetical protein
MSNLPAAQQPDEMRTDLLAILAAGRELGPEMDATLADSYLRQHPAPSSARQQSAPPAPSAIPRSLLPWAGALVALAVVLVALAASGGHAFWLLWLLWLPLMMSGWWWRAARPSDPWRAGADN